MICALFLTIRMGRGFGVDLVVNQLISGLRASGHQVWTACLTQDGHYSREGVHSIAPDAKSVRHLARALSANVLIVHSSPFFELVPELSSEFPCVVWEHGDPTPELFDPSERSARRAVKAFKTQNVYPCAAAVVAISRFVAADIGWPGATIAFNGADHASFGPRAKTRLPGPLRVGVIMRFGRGESRYKGVDELILLARALRADGIETRALGRGDPKDAAALEREGIRATLNATDEEKNRFLRELDVFFSGSLWEGCNLPLLEAQAAGAVGLALETGAHPEMTPFPLASLDLAIEQIRAYAGDEKLLSEHQKICTSFVKRYRWEDAAQVCEEVALSVLRSRNSVPDQGASRAAGPSWVLRSRLARARAAYALKIYGPRLLAIKVANRVWRMTWRSVCR